MHKAHGTVSRLPSERRTPCRKQCASSQTAEEKPAPNSCFVENLKKKLKNSIMEQRATLGTLVPQKPMKGTYRYTEDARTHDKCHREPRSKRRRPPGLMRR